MGRFALDFGWWLSISGWLLIFAAAVFAGTVLLNSFGYIFSDYWMVLKPIPLALMVVFGTTLVVLSTHIK